MKEVNTEDMTVAQEAEMKAAFGEQAVENGDIIELEPDDLAEPTPTRYPMADEIEVGDHVVIGSKRHDNVIASGTVTEMESYSMTLDPDESDMSGYFGFDGFGGERGTMFTLEEVNGENVDVEYGEVEVDE